MSDIQCPDCMQHLSDADRSGELCPHCGKALPLWITGPDRLSADQCSPTARRARRYASSLLFTLAAIHGVFGFLVIVLGAAGPIADEHKPILAAIVAGMVAILVSLGCWARHKPMLPTIIALVVYVVDTGVGIAIDPDQWTKGIVFRLLIVLLLVKAIQIARGKTLSGLMGP